RAFSSHVTGGDDDAAGDDARRPATALRSAAPGIQSRAAARGTRATAAGAALCGLAPALPCARRGPMVRREAPGSTREGEGPDPMAGRVRLHQRGGARRTRRPRRDRTRGLGCPVYGGGTRTPGPPDAAFYAGVARPAPRLMAAPARRCGNAAPMDRTERGPPELGKLAENASFPHSHKRIFFLVA